MPAPPEAVGEAPKEVEDKVESPVTGKRPREDAEAPAEASHELSGYQLFLSQEIPRLKAAHPGLEHKAAFAKAAAAWRTSPLNPKSKATH